MFKSYKNAFYSKFLDIYTSILYNDGDGDGGKKDGDEGKEGGGSGIEDGDGGIEDGGKEGKDDGDGGKGEGSSKRLAIYNKFIDLYALYYKNEEFVISLNMNNEELLSWKHEKMPMTINVVNNQIRCPKYPLYNLTSIKEFIFTEPINIKLCNDLIVIMYLGGYVNSLYAEQKMIELYNLQALPSLHYNLNKTILD